MEARTKTKKSFLKNIKWKRVILIVLTFSIVIVGSLGVYFAWSVYKETDNFDASKLLSGQASRLLDANGEVYYVFGSDENGKRVNVEYEDLPQVLVDAVVAAEDSRYFEHDGFDLPRIAKAFISNLAAGRITGGGSTITQQVVKKSYFPNEEKTYTRKFSEIFLSMEASKEVSKEEILTMYLNKIYFGRSLSSIGISAASHYYFNKEVSQLTLPEAALLAGALNSPSNYDAYYNLELATLRRDKILGLMVTHGYITQEECDDAKSIPVQNTLSQGINTDSNGFEAYISLVAKEVKDRTGIDPADTQMDIYTYLNPDIQTYADELANDGFKFPDEYMQVGASIQSVQDGRIVSVIGGRNYENFGSNRSDMKKQPGSALKPVVSYGAAFEFLNWSTGHEVEDKAYNKKSGWNPTNYDGSIGKYGKMSIAKALYNSWNLPAIWALDDVVDKLGGKPIYEMFQSFGVDMTDESVDIGPAFAIGGWAEGTSPIEMASIYATVANAGVHIESHTINYIDIISDGSRINVDEEIQTKTDTPISAETAFMIREVQAEQLTEPGTGYSALKFGEIRAKTGTTNHAKDSKFKGAAKDSWLAAYNPDYAVAVWMGYDEADASDHMLTMNSGNRMLIAREFCAEIYKKLTENGVQNSFPEQPDGVYPAQMVRGTYPYKSPNANTPADKIITAWFKKGYGPDGTVEDLGINNLSSFDATLNSKGQIAVTFAAYDPADAVTNPDANDATKMYGCVRYGVDIKDYTTGEVLQSYDLESPSATLDYVPKGSVTVTGYYKYQNSSLRSNEIPKTLSVNVTFGNIQYSVSYGGAAITGPIPLIDGKGQISVSVTRQHPDSLVYVTLLSETGTILSEEYKIPLGQSGCLITLDSPGTYKIQIKESYNDQSAPTVSYTVIAY